MKGYFHERLFKGAKAKCIPITITTREEHGWIRRFFKTGSATILFQKFGLS
jgi:hypothetical protein